MLELIIILWQSQDVSGLWFSGQMIHALGVC